MIVISVIVASLPLATGPLVAAAFVLAVAGAAKLRRPAPTGLALARAGLPGSDPIVRALGAAEVVVAAGTVALGGPWAAPLALLYVGFAAFTTLQVVSARRTGEVADCGCFGERSAPVGATHVAANLALAAIGLWALVAPTAGVAASLDASLGATVGVVALGLLAAAAIRALLTDLPALTAAQVTPARGTS
ncbi:MauE/DoxX family redox-associated membrane protein [Iamia sp.]|uniref:MauE/DoxX family redox-associated membrane protein n=1 Tax=Iamia sp. TaxID=2722710 RepID=UPI002CD2B50F|nr:MauE/DoxX family redox-associated membrane protein [Iamia sp.]HXH55768.1 MauE/DoxX family redox-associated membrane protein [Iamia sp.]